MLKPHQEAIREMERLEGELSPLNARKQEFIALAEASGWKQAEIARRLEVTRAGVSGIITGDNNPSATLLRLFKVVLLKGAKETASVCQQLRERGDYHVAIQDLVAEIDRVEPDKRKALFTGLRAVVESFPRRRRTGKRSRGGQNQIAS